MSDNLIPMLPQPPEVFVKLPANDEAKATANPPPMTADEIRHKIVEQFEIFEPHLKGYHEYAERISALTIEYHNLCLSGQLDVPIELFTLMATLDVRETPKSLDTKLAQLKTLSVKVKRIIFDHAKGIYYLFI